MSYTNVHVNISENQQQKLKHAVDTKSPVSICLGYEDLCGSDVLALTNSQVNRMTKAYQDGPKDPSDSECKFFDLHIFNSLLTSKTVTPACIAHVNIRSLKKNLDKLVNFISDMKKSQR